MHLWIIFGFLSFKSNWYAILFRISDLFHLYQLLLTFTNPTLKIKICTSLRWIFCSEKSNNFLQVKNIKLIGKLKPVFLKWIQYTNSRHDCSNYFTTEIIKTNCSRFCKEHFLMLIKSWFIIFNKTWWGKCSILIVCGFSICLGIYARISLSWWKYWKLPYQSKTKKNYIFTYFLFTLADIIQWRYKLQA